jgi:iron-sulfur cluster assembly accessory protein
MATALTAEATPVVSTTKGLTLTQGAADMVLDLVSQQERDDLALRVYVAGGGCSGLQYGMALDENVEEDDVVFESLGVKIVVDPMSLRYIDGSTVDYVTTGMGGGFKVENPNSTGGCGCGSSFSTTEGGSSGGGCSSCSSGH